MKTKLSLLVTLALFVCMVTPVVAHPGTLYVDDDFSPSMPGYGTTYFSNIQDAIDAASNGDTIYVYPGTYTENVAVNKQVHLRSVAGAAATTVDANGTGSGFHISANGVLIDGFTIVNAKAADQHYAGVFVNGVRGVEVMRNVIHDCQYGIYLYQTGSGTTNKVHDNTVYDSVRLRADKTDGVGIIAWGDSAGNSDLEITDNEVYNSDRQGIFVGGYPNTVRSSNVLVSRNIVHDNGKAGVAYPDDGNGIHFAYVDDSTISWNEIYNHGSWTSAPTFYSFAIHVSAGDNNVIRSNHCYHNSYGVVIFDGWPGGSGDPNESAQYNQIVRNNLDENWRGIYVGFDDAAEKTTVQYNRITGHTSYGVRKYPADSGTTLVAEYNWWSSSAGPGSGEANGITERVDADPWSMTLALPVGSEVSRIKVGESKTLDVKIWADSLYGLQFIVNYDTAPIDKSAHSWASGPWYADYIVWDGVTDEGAGTVKFAATQLRDLHPDNATLSGDEVADVTFLGTAPGTSTVHFTNIKLADKGGDLYPAAIQDHLIIVEAATGSIIGVVNMQARSNDSGAQVYVIPGGYEATTIGNGSFVVSDVPEGSGYTVLAEMSRYLDAEKTGVTVTGGGATDLGTVTLLGGDANDDDVIDILDLAIIGGDFGKTSGFDPRADINDDGEVDIVDLVLAGGNYDLSSPVAWA